MKKFLPQLPGFILSAGFVVTGIIDLIHVGISLSNLIPIGIGILFFLQSWFNWRVLTLISNTLLMLVCGYFFLALLSEYSEFEIWTRTVWLNFNIGCLIFGGAGILALLNIIPNWFKK